MSHSSILRPLASNFFSSHTIFCGCKGLTPFPLYVYCKFYICLLSPEFYLWIIQSESVGLVVLCAAVLFRYLYCITVPFCTLSHSRKISSPPLQLPELRLTLQIFSSAVFGAPARQNKSLYVPMNTIVVQHLNITQMLNAQWGPLWLALRYLGG